MFANPIEGGVASGSVNSSLGGLRPAASVAISPNSVGVPIVTVSLTEGVCVSSGEGGVASLCQFECRLFFFNHVILPKSAFFFLLFCPPPII